MNSFLLHILVAAALIGLYAGIRSLCHRPKTHMHAK